MSFRLESIEKQLDLQRAVLLKTIEAFRAAMRSEFATLRANNQLEVLRQVPPLSERLTVVEKKA